MRLRDFFRPEDDDDDGFKCNRIGTPAEAAARAAKEEGDCPVGCGCMAKEVPEKDDGDPVAAAGALFVGTVWNLELFIVLSVFKVVEENEEDES